MAKFKPVRAFSNTVDRVPLKQGQVIFVEDTCEIHWDPTSDKRVRMRDVIIVNTENERTEILAPLSKFYYVIESNVLYRFGADGQWKTVSDMSSVQGHINDKKNPHNVTADQVGAIPATQKGAKSGVASLDASGKVPSDQLPAMNYAPASHVNDTTKHITSEERQAWNNTTKDGPFLPLKGGRMDDDAFISCKNLAFTTQAMPGAAGDHTLDIYLSEDRHGSGSKFFDVQLSSPYVFKEFGIDANGEETIFLEQTTMDDGKTNGLKIGWGYDGVSLYAGKTKTFDGVGIRVAGEKAELVNSKILWPESIVNKEYVDGFAPKYTKITLTASGWDSSAKTQKVTVNGVLADETKQLIMPMPAMASQNDYAEAGIACTLQEANALTFKCQTVPTKDITVFVTVQEVAG